MKRPTFDQFEKWADAQPGAGLDAERLAAAAHGSQELPGLGDQQALGFAARYLGGRSE